MIYEYREFETEIQVENFVNSSSGIESRSFMYVDGTEKMDALWK